MTDRARYHGIDFRWSNEPMVSGLHVLPVDLTADEQAILQPHIDAIVEFWRARARGENERTAAMGGGSLV